MRIKVAASPGLYPPQSLGAESPLRYCTSLAGAFQTPENRWRLAEALMQPRGLELAARVRRRNV